MLLWERERPAAFDRAGVKRFGECCALPMGDCHAHAISTNIAELTVCPLGAVCGCVADMTGPPLGAVACSPTR